MDSESKSHEIVSKRSEGDSSHIYLQSKIAELKKMREDLNRAKDQMTQSWLDSRPLIDKLEKKQSELASAKDRVAKANLIVSVLQLQLETIRTRIRTQKEEEDNYRNAITERNQELHKKHEEMETIKLKIDRRRRVRSKLRQALKIKRRTIQTMELTYKAIRLESEAFRRSEDQALRYVDRFEGADVMLEMNRDEYEAMKKRAREETLAAERRVLLAADVKAAAEKRRDLAFGRLQTLYPNNVTRGVSNNSTKMISRDHGKSEITGNNKQQNLGKKHKYKKTRIRYSFKVRKPSIHVRIKFLLVRISKCFK